MQQHLSHTPEAVLVEIAGVLHTTEDPFDAPAHLVELLPQWAGSWQCADDTRFLSGVLPDFIGAVMDALHGFERAPAIGATKQVVAGIRVRADVLHLLSALAGGRTLGCVDSSVEFLVNGLSDMDYRSNSPLVEEAEIIVRVVASVGQQESGLEPFVSSLRLPHYLRQERRFAGVGSGEDEAEWDAVERVGDCMEFVAKTPLDVFLVFGFDAVLVAPASVHIATRVTLHGFSVWVPVGLENGSVGSEDFTEVRQFHADLVGDGDEALLDKGLEIGESGEEAAEGGFTRYRAIEAADFAELSAATETVYQLYVIADVEYVLAEPCSPHGAERITRATDQACLLESVKEFRVIDAIHDGREEAIAAFGGLRGGHPMP